MNFKQLRYFTRAIEVGNITHAAEKLNIAQTALGIQIRNLEEELGVHLLNRHSRGVEPTLAGELLYRHALEILARLETAGQEVKAAGSPDKIVVNMGLTPSIMRLVGAEIIEEAAKELPEIALRLVEEFSFILQRRLERDELHYALTYNAPIEQGFTRKALLEEDLLFATSPENWNGEPAISFAEAMNTELALASRQDVVWHLVRDEATRLSLPFKVAYEVQSVRAIKNLVAKGAATSILPRGAMIGELRSGVIASQLIERPRITRTLFLVRRRQGVVGLNAVRFEAFIDRLVDRLNAEIGEHSRHL
ncbi:LysR family transcriptional regulator [Fertoebacter nigrum]|uniref:LysR family transcriptional regulator n=1 Tax=Fertoeibacter niger TaxID=2656921 RepID=A0A8X8KQ60_9RHOB|nr:LysR family transcriptional regulator [Fertoeibacter niger]NUB45855.1 LysR family transcriptional regulator [Fertoeibacter niger]